MNKGDERKQIIIRSVVILRQCQNQGSCLPWDKYGNDLIIDHMAFGAEMA